MKNNLRKYQSEAVESVMSFFDSYPDGNPLVVAPTGAGKTRIMREVINRLLLKTDKKIVVLTPRVRLLQQISAVISGGLLVGTLGQKDTSSDVIISTVQTFIKHKVDNVGYIIFDECHLLSVVQEEESEIRRRLSKSYRHAPIIGLTATPFRRNVLLSEQAEWTEVFNISVSDLIEGGYLAPMRPIKTDTKLSPYDVTEAMSEDLEEITSSIIQTAREVIVKNDRRNVLVFAKSIKHASFIRQYLNSLNERAILVHSRIPQNEIDRKCAQFEQKGERQWMINVGLLTIGYDNPNIDALVYIRSIKSLTLWIQSLGRGMRVSSTKKDCLLLDFGNHVSRFGPLDRLLTNSRKPSSTSHYGNLTRYCRYCDSENPITARTCLYCEAEIPTRLHLSDASEGLDVITNGYDVDTVRDITGSDFNSQTVLAVMRSKEPIYIDRLLINKPPKVGDEVMIKRRSGISMCIRVMS